MALRFRMMLLLATGAALVAFALVLALDRPAGRRPGAPSSTSGAPALSASDSGFDGAALPAGVPARGFTLSDQSGEPTSLRRLRGQVVLLAFLDSTCGPSCVLIAQQIRGALDELSRPVAALIVSVDPAADTPAHVSRFLAQMSLTGRVRYLTGPLSELRPLWRAYRAPPAGAGTAVLDTSAVAVLIDARGFERVLFPLEQLTPESLAHDIRRLQSER
jgi:cytochrome oxidase Cu insertion factor (SCO1/SenC/PrrC family)